MNILQKAIKMVLPGATPSDVAEVNFSTIATTHNEGHREGAAKSIQRPIVDMFKWLKPAVPNFLKRTINATRNSIADVGKGLASPFIKAGEGIVDTVKWTADTAIKLATTPIAITSNIVYQVMNVVPSLFPIRAAVIGIDYSSILARKPGEYSNRLQKATVEKTGNVSNSIKERINSTRDKIFNTIAGPQSAAA